MKLGALGMFCLLLAGLLMTAHEAKGQNSSDLPVVVIETNRRVIPDNRRISVSMKVIACPEGQKVGPDDPATDYDGKVSIETRGHSSQFLFPEGKRSYGFETQDSAGENLNVSILGMPEENDWILYGPYSDKTLIRNVVVFHFGRKAGLLAPRTEFVNLWLNGEPKGLHVWMEKIKQDKNRVDIAKLAAKDTVGEAMTGGYIFKVDWPNNVPNEGWVSPYPPNNGTGQETVFVMQDPKPDELHRAQLAYISEHFTEFETVLLSENFADTIAGYRRFIDVDSWVNFFLISELFRDTDAYRCSLYMYKDRDRNGGKITMGPLWDYNYSMGNYDNFNVFSTEGWAYLFNYDCNTRAKINPFWYERLMQDSSFVNAARTRWDELRNGALHSDSIMQFIDQTVSRIGASADANFQIWPVLDTYLWPNYYVGGTYANEIAWIKNWLTQRAAWIDAHLPGKNTSSTEVITHPDFARLHAYPNPFTTELHLRFVSRSKAPVTFIISDMLGRRQIERLMQPKGEDTEYYSLRELDPLSAGVYVLQAWQNGRLAAKVLVTK